MIINMQILPEGHSTLTGTTNLEAVKADLPTFLEEISYNAEIDRIRSNAYVHVTFKGIFQLQCSRCLNNFSLTINSDFSVIIKERVGNCSAQSDSDSVDFYYDNRHEQIDISPAFFDEIMLSVPLKPLCSESCEGIDIDGLKNVYLGNEEKLQKNKSIDPRWEALKRLKK